MRSRLLTVIDGLSQEHLIHFGQQIKKLPVQPIVTLVTTVPVLDKSFSEQNQLKARRNLAVAKEALNIHAATEIIHGSNPMSAETFFMKGAFDAMIKKDQNGQLAIIVKNYAPGIKELARDIRVIESKPLQHSYKGLFAKPQIPAVTAAENKPNTQAYYFSPRPR